MRYAIVLLLLVTSVVALSRKKRYLVFPEGSTIAVEVNQNTRLVPDDLSDWVCIQSVDTSLQLPSEADLFLHEKKSKKRSKKKKSRRKDKWRRHRRDRRQLYSRIDDLLYSLGLDGTACVRRALCEAAERAAPAPGSHLLSEALHLIFSKDEQSFVDLISSRQILTSHEARAHIMDNGIKCCRYGLLCLRCQ